MGINIVDPSFGRHHQDWRITLTAHGLVPTDPEFAPGISGISPTAGEAHPGVDANNSHTSAEKSLKESRAGCWFDGVRGIEERLGSSARILPGL